MTTAAASLEFDTQTARENACIEITTGYFINTWLDVDGDGKAQVFTVSTAAAGPANLKTLNTNAFANIKTINTNTIANTKTYNTQT